jgi:pyruvate/2-oxoglutarate dehydrogenase complex dihydrolipoamide dehydrogenase (E3) component
VWAIGECAGSPQFTHVSEDDFRIIRDNLAGGARSTRDARHDRILGFTMIGPAAGEVLATVQALMLAEFPYSMLRYAVLAHPTMAEGLGPL